MAQMYLKAHDIMMSRNIIFFSYRLSQRSLLTAQTASPTATVVYRFCGATTHSCSLRSLLRFLVLQINAAYGRVVR